jgi:DNA-binding NtrC family response regulator
MDNSKILLYVLEDNRTETLILKLAFTHLESTETVFFSQGFDMLKAIEDRKPDIIVTDYMLPDINGNELLHKIKQLAPKSKMVVMSAIEDIGVIVTAQELEVANFIVKSSSCMRYLRTVLDDLFIVVNYHKSVEGLW